MRHRTAILRVPMKRDKYGLWRIPDEKEIIGTLKEMGVPLRGETLTPTTGELYRARWSDPAANEEEAVFLYVCCKLCELLE